MFDIRNKKSEKVTSVRFADTNDDGGNATIIFTDTDEAVVYISDNDSDFTLLVESERDAVNLIEALQFAISEQWWG